MELDDFIIPSYMSFNWHATIMKSFSFFLSIYLSILPSIRLSMTYRFLFNELSFVFTGIYLNAQVVPDLGRESFFVCVCLCVILSNLFYSFDDF